MLLCSMQDIWGFITSMQMTIMKQSEELKTLALKNQELEHRIQVQDMHISHQKEQLQRLQEAFDKQTLITPNTLATHEEKITHINASPSRNVSGNVGSLANIVRNGQASLHTQYNDDEMYDNEEEKEKEYHK